MEEAHRLDRQDAIWLAIIALLAALLRLPALDRVPPGYQFDEAYNALDALEVLAGNHRLFLPANGGREVLYTYLQAPLVALLGPAVEAGRLASALAGIVTVCVLYLFVRRIWPQRRVAVLAGVLLACSYWHLHFSRYGIRSIVTPLWFLLTFDAVWRGIATGKRGWYALAGVWMAANVWTHPAGRLAPVIVLLVAAMAWRADPMGRRQLAIGIAIAAAVAMALYAPLAWHYYRHPLTFYSHAGDVAIVHWGDWRGSAQRIVENGWRILAMFNLRGDLEWIHNLPGRPVFDVPTGIAFLAGAVVVARRAVWAPGPERLPYGVLLAWGITLALISLVTDMAPNFSRMMGALPVLIITAALGLDAGYRLIAPSAGATWAVAIVAAILAVGGASTGWDYFVRFARDPRASYQYDQDKIEAVSYLTAASVDHTVFLAELWAQHATIQLLTRDEDIRSLDTLSGIVFSAEEGRGALYAYPPEQQERAQALQGRWGEWGTLETVYDSQGQVLLHLFAMSPAQLQALRQAELAALRPPETATTTGSVLADGVRLRGWQAAPEADAQGELAVTLLWECAEPRPLELTSFVHLVAPDGQCYAQADQQPLQGSYATDEWHRGDLVLDRMAVPLPAVMPEGDYALQVGVYQLRDTAEGVITDQVASAQAGTIDWSGVVPVSAEGLAGHEIEPIEDGLVEGVIAPEQLELLVPAPLSIVVAPDGALAGAEWQVQLEGAPLAAPQSVGSLELPELDAWAEADALVLSDDLTVTDVAPGEYALVLRSPDRGEAVALGAVEVIASRRLWALPAVHVATDIQVGDWARLAGVSSPSLNADGLQASAGVELRLTLAWQATGEVNRNLSVFCHLVDENGQIVAQHDGAPQGGAMPTSDWLAGQVVLDEIVLPVPQDAAAGTYQLRVGLYDPISGQREAIVQHGAPSDDGAALLPVAVRIGAEGAP
ncbi:MAG: glycosyltransferase family 39 protein [Anaerolineae bacterium]